MSGTNSGMTPPYADDPHFTASAIPVRVVSSSGGGGTGTSYTINSSSDINANLSGTAYTLTLVNEYLPIAPQNENSLPTIVAPSNASFGGTYAFNLEDTYNNIVRVGCISENSHNTFGIYSPGGHSVGINLSDYSGTSVTIGGHTSSDGVSEVECPWVAANGNIGEGGFRWIDSDAATLFWKYSTSCNTGSLNNLSLIASSNNSAWNTTPVMQHNATSLTTSFVGVQLQGATTSTLPTASSYPGLFMYVTNQTNPGMAGTLVFSDGNKWNPVSVNSTPTVTVTNPGSTYALAYNPTGQSIVYDITPTSGTPCQLTISGGVSGFTPKITVIVRGNGTQVTLPAASSSMKYPSGQTQPATANGSVSVINFITPDNGTTQIGGI